MIEAEVNFASDEPRYEYNPTDASLDAIYASHEDHELLAVRLIKHPIAVLGQLSGSDGRVD